MKPSGVKSYLVQYRNAEGRTRRLVLGQHGALTPEVARDLARKKLTAVAAGEDPSKDRHAARAGMTLAEVCDWYLKEAGAGRLLGRNRRPIKASTLHMDRRPDRRPTLSFVAGSRHTVSGLTLRDVEGMQADNAAGKCRTSIDEEIGLQPIPVEPGALNVWALAFRGPEPFKSARMFLHAGIFGGTTSTEIRKLLTDVSRC